VIECHLSSNSIRSILLALDRLKGTDWGELDVLILDLPPGTGDVQLTICQELQLDGAVAVTTPSLLAIEDTRKGIHMFSSLGVPTVALVENMSYFVVRKSAAEILRP
jgi:Mrp family chromosome partitioning ATPase